MTDEAAFAPGQIWTYRGAQLPTSRVVIGRIDAVEQAESQPIVSITVTDVLLPDPENGTMQPRMIQHSPLAADALRGSLLDLEGSGPVPEEFEDGYRVWREAFDTQQGGFFTIGVEELIQMFQTALAPERQPS